jgi:hypothetical protein
MASAPVVSAAGENLDTAASALKHEGRCTGARRLLAGDRPRLLEVGHELPHRLDSGVFCGPVPDLPDRGEGDTRELRKPLRRGMAQALER